MPSRMPKVKRVDEGISRRSSRAFEKQETPPPFPPINRAAMDNDVEKMVKLLEAGADIEQPDNIDRATPLINACRHNKPAAALELIRRGANIDAYAGGAPITWTVVNGMVEVGRQLIEKGCDLNIRVNSHHTIPDYARDYRTRYPEFYKMIGEAIEARDRRIAAEAQAAADARTKAYADGATILNSPITVTKPITLKR